MRLVRTNDDSTIFTWCTRTGVTSIAGNVNCTGNRFKDYCWERDAMRARRKKVVVRLKCGLTMEGGCWFNRKICNWIVPLMGNFYWLTSSQSSSHSANSQYFTNWTLSVFFNWNSPKGVPCAPKNFLFSLYIRKLPLCVIFVFAPLNWTHSLALFPLYFFLFENKGPKTPSSPILCLLLCPSLIFLSQLTFSSHLPFFLQLKISSSNSFN